MIIPYMIIFMNLFDMSVMTNEIKVKFCGKSLSSVLADLCITYNSPPVGSYTNRRDGGIVDVCCDNPCTLTYLQSYCAEKHESVTFAEQPTTTVSNSIVQETTPKEAVDPSKKVSSKYFRRRRSRRKLRRSKKKACGAYSSHKKSRNTAFDSQVPSKKGKRRCTCHKRKVKENPLLLRLKAQAASKDYKPPRYGTVSDDNSPIYVHRSFVHAN